MPALGATGGWRLVGGQRFWRLAPALGRRGHAGVAPVVGGIGKAAFDLAQPVFVDTSSTNAISHVGCVQPGRAWRS
ncbi:MAG: hypothetical protein WAQ05_04210 [Rubrivivax sp.]